MELKNLLENASLSFSFAKDLFKHNLVIITLLNKIASALRKLVQT